MTRRNRPFRLLIVTPEVTTVPQGMGPKWHAISARAGGLGDICALQIHAFLNCGMDVHLALPNYRDIFRACARGTTGRDISRRDDEPPFHRIHLAQDCSFYHHSKLSLTANWDNLRISLAFQREVINRIIPEVRPDLIHCFGWMTGLVPAMARQMGIPCFFTFHRTDSARLLLSTIEERGIDAATFWRHCFYARMPASYEETRNANPLDLLTTGVFAAQSVFTCSETFQKWLMDTGDGRIDGGLKIELAGKLRADRLCALAPVPDASFNPANDADLMRSYGPEDHYPGKLFNKLHLQEILNLSMDTTSPVCLWPSRLDGSRPGCRLMADTLADILARYREPRLQIVFVADGDFQDHLRGMIQRLHASKRATVCDFDARRYRLACAGSDFVLMPSFCNAIALSCKIGQCYGSIPITYDGGAVHDGVTLLNTDTDGGSGFFFRDFDRPGLLWALDQAMAFYRRPTAYKIRQVKRIMAESMVNHGTDAWVQKIVDQYASVLKTPMPHARVHLPIRPWIPGSPPDGECPEYAGMIRNHRFRFVKKRNPNDLFFSPYRHANSIITYIPIC